MTPSERPPIDPETQKPRRSPYKARGAMILAMGIFGTVGIFVRKIGLPSGESALYRAVLAILLVGGVLLVRKEPLPLRRIGRELPLLLLSGAAMGINWILLFEAYRYTTVSVATLTYYFAPVLVTLLCPFLFRERMTARAWVSFVGSTVGLVLLTGLGDLGTGSAHLTGILFGFGAAVFYAAVILLNKAIRSVGGLQRTFLQFVAATAVLLPYVLLTGGFHLASLDGIGWAALLTVGLVHTGVAYLLYFPSLGGLSGRQAAVLSYLDPLVAVLASVFVLGESITLPQAIGGAMILGFTMVGEKG